MKGWLTSTLLATVCWGFWAFIPKLTTSYIRPQSAILYEIIGGMIVGIFIFCFSNYSLQIDAKGVVFGIATGIFGVLGAYFFLHAITSGKTSSVVVLTSLYPLLTLMLAVAILGERLNLKQLLGAFFGIFSIILIVSSKQ